MDYNGISRPPGAAEIEPIAAPTVVATLFAVPRTPSHMIDEGMKAPDFSLPGIHGSQPAYYNLMDPIREGKAALLLWYPVDFVPTITPDLVAAGEFADRDDLVVWGISSDSLFAHEEYAETRGIEIPLLSDLHVGIADAYDAVYEDFRGHNGVPARAVVVVDPDWTVRYAWHTDDPLAAPTESPLVGAAETLSEVLGEQIEAPNVEYE